MNQEILHTIEPASGLASERAVETIGTIVLSTGEQSAAIHHVPEPVRRAYDLDAHSSVSQLDGGLVNATYLVEQQGQARHIVQRLHPSFGPELLTDSQTVSTHLAQAGWETPQLRRTAAGELYTQDAAGDTWRSVNYIPSDGIVPTMSPQLLTDAAHLLARWHSTVRSLDYMPKHQLPHFHDIHHYAAKLHDYRPRLPDSACRYTADILMDIYDTLSALSDSQPQQLIHGDPKLANMLYRNGKPFTLIDFDTVMQGPPLYDIGDLLRSSLQQAERAGKPFTSSDIRAAAMAYREVACPEADADAFFDDCMRATQRISVELGMRYLLDVAEADYFTWDEKRFGSRRDHHMYKINGLLALCHSLPLTQKAGD